MTDNRVGEIGVRKPELSLSGKAYTWPGGGLIMLDHTHYVVLDVGYNDPLDIEKWLKELQPHALPENPKSKKL